MVSNGQDYGQQEAARSLSRRYAAVNHNSGSVIEGDLTNATNDTAALQSRRKRLKIGGAPNSMSPLISIVMPVWNGEKYLAEAVESCFTQTFQDFELIVVDDGSTDGTARILDSCKDLRLRVFRLDHGGIVNALNFGVAQSRAEWIARHDADDRSRPNRLQRQWSALQKNRDAVLCFTGTSLLNESDAKIGQSRLPRTRALIALRLCFQCPITHSTVIFKKETFHKVGGYRSDERHAEDYALWGRMIERGEFVALPERLLQFRVHTQSVSKQNLKTQLLLTSKIGDDHCARFMGLGRAESARAREILSRDAPERSWEDWFWFLKRCLPSFRWKSKEFYTWIAWQTLKTVCFFQSRQSANSGGDY